MGDGEGGVCVLCAGFSNLLCLGDRGGGGVTPDLSTAGVFFSVPRPHKRSLSYFFLYLYFLCN